MSEVLFTRADLAEIRFCVSPLWETVTSLWALNDPGRHSVHLPWVKWARPLAQRADLADHLALLRAFVRPKTWLPDFLTPAPRGPLVDFAEEAATVRATAPEIVTADITATTRSQPLSPLAREVADDPVRMLPRVVDALDAWWTMAIAPHWPRMRALLEADIAYRSKQLAEGGVRLLFDSLHPDTRWVANRLVIDDPHEIRLDLRGRGLPLTPSVFVDRRPVLTITDWAPPWAVYPARAVGTLWEGRNRSGAALERLLGASRARLLGYLASPATTTQLADRTGLTPGAVSQHLTILYDAGLVDRSRQGREVIYLLTETGTALLNTA